MVQDAAIPIGGDRHGKTASLHLAMAARHGFICGATGTGKTVTLQTLAEGFSAAGVPVFTADIKGDLSGLAAPGSTGGRIKQRLAELKIDSFTPEAGPVVFWDVFGERGHCVRASLSEFGPLLLSRVLELNEVQQQVLQVCFSIADDEGLLLLDLKDLRELLAWAGEHLKDLRSSYGNISQATLGSIQRGVFNLSERGGDRFFGEPGLSLNHLMQRDSSGRGVISVMHAASLLHDPLLYSTLLLWLLSELFEELPEAGDLEKPKLVFFFDEAHLLFRDAQAALISKVEQVVRLIRSKGVGVFFVTQNPADIPDAVLAQLGNKFQHALRAYTPKEQKIIRSAADSFRANPAFSTGQAITELEVGEALVSVLDQAGRPEPVERLLIYPPHSRIGPLDDQEREKIVRSSPLHALYGQAIDRESAFEKLKKRRFPDIRVDPPPKREAGPPPEPALRRASSRATPAEALMTSAARSIGSALGRQIVRGILGAVRRR